MSRNSGKADLKGLKEVLARLEAMKKLTVVAGVPASSADGRKDGLSNVTIAAAHEFGATIQHPGGTAYGYKNEKDARAGKSRFLRSGQGFMQTGTTGPHTIIIPERSFLRSTMDEKRDKYTTDLGKGIRSALLRNENINDVFSKFGEQVVRDVKSKIQSGIEPPLSKSTIRRKKSSKPLIDTGQLVQSITWEVRND